MPADALLQPFSMTALQPFATQGELGPGAVIADDMTQLEIGKAVEVLRGQRVAILNFGTLLPQAMSAAKQLNAICGRYALGKTDGYQNYRGAGW